MGGYSNSITDINNRVGIGITSPSDKLDVNGFIRTSGNTGGLLIGHGSGDYGIKIGRKRTGDGQAYLDFITSPDPTAGAFNTRFGRLPGANSEFRVLHNGTGNFTFTGANGADFVFNTGGNVGIGTTNPTNTLHVSSSAGSARITSTAGGANLFLESVSGNLSRIRWNGLSSFAVRDDADSSDRLVIDTSGNIGINTTSPSEKLEIIGNVKANNFILSSDKRYKTNIKNLSSVKINTKWKSFELKENENDYRVGVIAQELEETNPEFVVTDNSGHKSVKYIDLLIAKIAELEERLEKAGL